ncbi:MAG: PQQ-binding-like beta-propeller repeat protein [Acidobacteria bacterium]|nr:PQQ-binding-like beta-propeller repeat protein [Acidobacteriota bacterium]
MLRGGSREVAPARTARPRAGRSLSRRAAAAGALACALASVAAPAGAACGSESALPPFAAQPDLLQAARLRSPVLEDLVLVGSDLRQVAALDGRTGRTLWRREVDSPDGPAPSSILAAFADLRLDRRAGADVFVLWREGAGGCEVARAISLRGADGRALARATVGSLLFSRGAEVAGVHASGAGDLTGDGLDEVVVEMLDHPKGSDGARAVYGPDHRDAAPGTAKASRIVVVEGASGRAALTVARRPSLGPGPMALVASPDRGQATLVTVEAGGTADGGEAWADVTAREAGAVGWRRVLRSLPVSYLLRDAGGAVVVGTAEIDAMTGAYRRTRFTVLDRETGAPRWSRDELFGAAVLVLRGGDLIIAGFPSFLERVRGADGTGVWRADYAQVPARPGALLDEDGDGLTDVLVRDTPRGTSVFSGATGEERSRPLYTAAADLAAVRDINADGADDVIGMLDGGSVVAYSGRTGTVLWISEQPLGNGPGVAMSARLRRGARQDVVLLWPGSEIAALDGRTGAVLWRRPA